MAAVAKLAPESSVALLTHTVWTAEADLGWAAWKKFVRHMLRFEVTWLSDRRMLAC